VTNLLDLLADLLLRCASGFVGMTTLGLRECDRLEGASNFTPWKYRLDVVGGG
jgi:hypothetical protein